MEKTFLIFQFQGIYLNKCRGIELKKMSLANCLKNVFNTSYDSNTKRFFNCHDMAFESHELTVEQIEMKVAELWAIFPVYEKQDIKEVKRYIDLGLVPVFMRYNDLRELRKIYG